jgi:hypothetical protein
MGEIHTSNNDDFKIEDAGIRIVRVHSDGGKEFEKLERHKDHLATYSAPCTPENNPISERGNRTLFDAARTLLIEADLPACSGLLRLSMLFTCGIGCAMQPRVIPRTIW